MSWFKKLFRSSLDDLDAELDVDGEAERAPLDRASPKPASAPRPIRDAGPQVPPIDVTAAHPPPDAEAQLERLGDARGTLDEPAALRLLERLHADGRDARAIDLARRILAHHPGARALHQRVAEMLTSRGDDRAADALVSPFVDAPGAPLDLCMLAAEIAERVGDADRALTLYERIVARDLDYPRARARVRKLREGEHHERDLGATLMTDGALTRGRYRVERELGRGGAGTVFLAEDLSIGRKIALKVYHRRGRAERARLLVEARVPARLEHPGVVRIFDLDESLAAIAMERVLGGSVRREIERGGSTPARLRRWFHTAAAALAHVHERGFVHRDIKPSNMLLRGDERVVLTDFGVACEAGWVAPEGDAIAEGTLLYMSKEHRAGAPATPAMDVYALGVSLQELLEQCAAEVPKALTDCAAACMREVPSQRPPASWVAEQLEER